jgi:hypothetical protein
LSAPQQSRRAGAVSSDEKHKPDLMTAINGKRQKKEDAVKNRN